MSIPKTIKQIMPIPDDYIILTKVVDEVGNTHMLNFSPMGYRYMYALVDCHGDRSDEVDVYVIRPDGSGYIDDSGITLVVPKYKCPHCGIFMKPQVDDGFQGSYVGCAGRPCDRPHRQQSRFYLQERHRGHGNAVKYIITTIPRKPSNELRASLVYAPCFNRGLSSCCHLHPNWRSTTPTITRQLIEKR